MTKTISDAKVERFEKAILELHAALPSRIWVEGDGAMYADFHSNERRRVRLSPFDAIKLIHQAAQAADRMIGI